MVSPYNPRQRSSDSPGMLHSTVMFVSCFVYGCLLFGIFPSAIKEMQRLQFKRNTWKPDERQSNFLIEELMVAHPIQQFKRLQLNSIPRRKRMHFCVVPFTH